ncbi:MAG: thioesterase domain-containing protein [Polyangiaceae bacterium]
MWHEVLGVSTLDSDSDFFELGGQSLQALQVASRLSLVLDRTITASALFRASTVGELELLLQQDSSAEVRSLPNAKSSSTSKDQVREVFEPVVVLNTGRSPSLYCVHSADCLALSYVGLRQHLPDRAILGFQAPGLTGPSPSDFESLVTDYVERLLARRPEGPIHLLGWSSGGGIAHAMATELLSRGRSIGMLAMLDSYPAETWSNSPEPTYADALVMLLDDVDASAFAANGRPYGEDELVSRLLAPQSSLSALGEPALRRLAETTLHGMRIYRRAKHPKYPGVVHYFRATRTPALPTNFMPGQFTDLDAMRERWRNYAAELRIIDVDASHLELCQPEPLTIVGQALAAVLE